MKLLKKLFLPLLFVGLTIGCVKVIYDVSFIAPTIKISQNEQKIISKNEQNNQKNDVQAKISSVGLTDLTEMKLQLNHTLNDYLVGQLVIPSIKLNLPILSRATDQTLSTGAAQYYPQRKMGQGNYVLASHNFSGAPVLLYAISQLKSGDKMYITNGTSTYEYTVSSNQVINETDTKVLTETTTARLTLLRCEGGIGTPYRRVVSGKMIRVAQDKAMMKKAIATTEKSSGYQALLQKMSQHKFILVAANNLALMLNGQRIGLLLGLLIAWLVIAFALIKIQL